MVWSAVCRLLACGVAIAPVALAQQARVVDINKIPASVGSNPCAGAAPGRGFARLGNTFLFAATGDSGAELYKATIDARGESAGLLKDIWPGSRSSAPSGFVTAGKLAFFVAKTEAAGRELWVSDGTAAGTRLVLDLFPGDSGVRELTALGTRVIFQARSAADGIELWISDGTAQGTRVLRDIAPGAAWSLPRHFHVDASGRRAYFAARTRVTGEELWITDGTTLGTRLVKDIAPAGASSTPRLFVNVAGAVLFSAETKQHGLELYRSDGTAAGTVLLKDIGPGPASGMDWLTQPVVHRGRAYFAGTDSRGTELWASDGTAKGTQLVAELEKGPGSSGPNRFVSFGSFLVFTAFTAEFGDEVWRLDASGRVGILADLQRGSADSKPRDLIVSAGRLYFTAYTKVTGRELYVATPNTIPMVRDLYPGMRSSYTSCLTATGRGIVFSANDGVLGQELYLADANGVRIAADLAKPKGRTRSSSPSWLAPVRDHLQLVADDGVHGGELWQSDGTDAGSKLTVDLEPGAASGRPRELVAYRDGFLFTAPSRLYGRELWFSDGTVRGTRVVADIARGSLGSSPAGIRVIGDRAFFTATDRAHGRELWVYDPQHGARVWFDVAPGSGSSHASDAVGLADGRIAFFTPVAGWWPSGSIWISDGTTRGTFELRKRCPSCGWLRVGKPFGVHGKVVFAARTAREGWEPWVSDGTRAGTHLLKDITSGATSSVVQVLGVSGGTWFFLADEPTTGTELWSSDGTSAGTKLVVDLKPGKASSALTGAVRSGTRHTWIVNATGALVRWDGRRATKIAGVVAAKHPTPFGNQVAFTIWDPKRGAELGVVSNGATVETVGTGCGPSAVTLVTTDPVLGTTIRLRTAPVMAGKAGLLLLGGFDRVGVRLGACRLQLDARLPLFPLDTWAGNGVERQTPLALPNDVRLLGVQVATQVLVASANGPETSNAVRLWLGR